MEHKEKVWCRWGWSYSDWKWRAYRFRFDPVPNTGKPSRLYPAIWRHPKTTQERKWSFADPEYVRGKRSARNIPNCWDDWTRTDWDNRSWKAKKVRKQWMKLYGRCR